MIWEPPSNVLSQNDKRKLQVSVWKSSPPPRKHSHFVTRYKTPCKILINIVTLEFKLKWTFVPLVLKAKRDEDENKVEKEHDESHAPRHLPVEYENGQKYETQHAKEKRDGADHPLGRNGNTLLVSHSVQKPRKRQPENEEEPHQWRRSTSWKVRIESLPDRNIEYVGSDRRGNGHVSEPLAGHNDAGYEVRNRRASCQKSQAHYLRKQIKWNCKKYLKW